MAFWQALIIAVIPSIAAVASARLGFRDLGVRRRLDTSRQFLDLFATAHGRPTDGREAVGVGEQVATVHLIADFAAEEDMLKNAAREGLKELATWGSGLDASIEEILPQLLDSLPDDKAAEAAAQAVAILKKSNASQQKIASAASDALRRLQS
ncbi:hypothetical protein EHW97_11265 [Aeromicrobium camelliae]|uniref:Uncharacterized protein n=1 Tax=Aeromicrobium camelliae TaxID=1538144 RepID=A0A3N6W657_9ACTN|nr:hypothetical protein [Aeromicrobium camelliae]RQN03006.1 hypothetical protein EHW97_11265 [Aeromicrobium camelliae]